jgi:hypothetical protein
VADEIGDRVQTDRASAVDDVGVIVALLLNEASELALRAHGDISFTSR